MAYTRDSELPRATTRMLCCLCAATSSGTRHCVGYPRYQCTSVATACQPLWLMYTWRALACATAEAARAISTGAPEMIAVIAGISCRGYDCVAGWRGPCDSARLATLLTGCRTGVWNNHTIRMDVMQDAARCGVVGRERGAGLQDAGMWRARSGAGQPR